jgi:hypothetical protein
MAMLQGIPVAFFSLEMTEKEMLERFYKRLIPSSDDGGDFLYPVFDCKANQNNTCSLSQRINRCGLNLAPDGKLPEFDRTSQYRACSICRGTNYYELSSWYELINRPAFDYPIKNRLDKMKEMFGHLYRIKTYPRFSANTSSVVRDLDIIEKTEGFVPKLICIDYVDVLKPERDELVGVQKEDEAWMSLARLAGERYSLVATGTQTTAKGLQAQNVTTQHTARWTGKLGHVDVMLALNQTEEEKGMGLMRISIMQHRHSDFLQTETCTVLQQLGVGQVHLDSYRKIII